MSNTPQVIYFVAVGKEPFEAVKIGYASNITERLRAYRQCNPHGPTLLGSLPGGPNTEAFLLRRFKQWHIRGEWFELTDDSRSLMLRVLSDGIPNMDAEEQAVEESTRVQRPPSLRLIKSDREEIAASDAQAVLICAGPGEPGESRKTMLVRAAQKSGLSYARIVAFFYAKGNPPPESRTQLLAAARRVSEAA